MDLSGRATCADVTERLADPTVDHVDLCVPSDEHAAPAIRALEAVEHALVEKPNVAD